MSLSMQDYLRIQFVVSAIMAIHITPNNDRNGRNNNRNGNGDIGDVRDVGFDIMYINPNSLSARYTWNRGLDVGLDIMYINPNSGSARYSRNRVLEIISSEDGGEPDHYYTHSPEREEFRISIVNIHIFSTGPNERYHIHNGRKPNHALEGGLTVEYCESVYFIFILSGKYIQI